MKRFWPIMIMIVAMSFGSVKLSASADLPPASVVDLGPTFSINPNPVSGTFFYVNLNFTEAQYPEAVIVINDILGKVVFSYPIRKSDYATSQIRVDLSDAMLDKGVYFLQVKSGDATKTLKLAIR
jgi:Secretion system C-terminal sorting domain